MFVRIYSIPIQLWFDRDLISPPVISPFFFPFNTSLLDVWRVVCAFPSLQEFQEMGQRLNELLFKGGAGSNPKVSPPRDFSLQEPDQVRSIP